MSLDNAIAIAEEAINYDNLEQDYQAIQKYKEAVVALKTAYADPENATSCTEILSKITEYGERIQYLGGLHPGEAV